MKKVLSLVAVCVLLVGMMACGVFSASAATPKEEVIAAVKGAVSADVYADYKPMIENVFSQIDVTAEQAKAVIANIEAVKDDVDFHSVSLSEYSAAETKVILKNLDEACATLGLGYELVAAKKPTHKGDVECVLYKLGDEETVVAQTDPDVKKTNAPETNVLLVVALISALAMAGVTVVFSKKLAR